MFAFRHNVLRRPPAAGLRRLVFSGLSILVGLNAADWHIEAVPDITGGKFSSLKVDRFGNAHVVHMEGSDHMLRYSFWDRTLKKWFSTDLERSSGFCSLALDSKQRPHVSYPAGKGVTHTYWDGNKWQKQFANVHARTIDYYTSIALDSQDNPTISFYEEVGAGEFRGRLRVVSWNGGYWELKTVDSDLGSGKFNSMNSNSKGYPEIAYANVEYANLTVGLRYARWDGTTWKTEILLRIGASMWSVAMALGPDDIPHIAYTDVAKHLVKYATQRNGKWEFETVDSIAQHAYPDRNGIALDAHGNPYVSYYDAGSGTLKVAHRANGRWIAEIVEQDFAGYTSSLQIAKDTIYLAYGDENGQRLRFAYRPLDAPAPASEHETAAKQK